MSVPVGLLAPLPGLSASAEDKSEQDPILTDRVILEVAQRLFVTDGSVATTIERIAAEAGVSAKTVYDAFVLRLIRGASSVDHDSAELWELIQSDFHANQRALVGAIAKRKGLQVGLSIDKAADILWTLNHPDTWLALHYERGWSAKEFEKWLATTAAQQFAEVSVRHFGLN